MAIPNIISGYLIASISEQLPQYFVALNIFLMSLTLNPIIMKETGQYLIKKILYLFCTYLSIEWDNFQLSSNTNTEKSYNTFLEKFESLLDTYASLKKISKNKLKFKDKPWITPGLQKSISINNQFL